MYDQLNYSNRRSDIQALRAIAVIFVVAYHLHFSFTHGYLGVDMFFAISGYVITQMLMKEYRDKQRIDFRSFFVRRFQRILPQLSLVVLFTSIVSIFLLSPSGQIQTNTKIGFFGLFLNANTAIQVWVGGYFDGPTQLNPLLHTWSLSVEEQFYLMYPLIFIFSARVMSRKAPVKFVVGAMFIGLIILSFLSTSREIVLRSIFPIGGFYGLFGRSWEFGIGAMFALIPASWTLLAKRNSAFVIGMIGTIMVIAPQAGFKFFRNPGNSENLLTVCGTSMILLAGISRKSPTYLVLKHKVLQVIGSYSYAIYIWHWPIIVFSKIRFTKTYTVNLSAIVFTLLISFFSHRFIELPQRDVGRKNQISKKLICLLALTIVSTGLIYRVPNWLTPKAVQMEKQHIGDRNGCRSTNLDLWGEGSCVFNVSTKRSKTESPIYLLGDSNADHFSEAVVTASKELRRPVYISNGCVFTELFVWHALAGANWTKNCHDYVEDLMDHMKSQKPSLIIISNSDHYFNNNNGFAGYSGWAVGNTINDLTENPITKLRLFEDSLRKTVKQLVQNGHKVLVIQTIPHFEIPRHVFDPSKCNIFAFKDNECLMNQYESSALVVQGGVRTAIQNLSLHIEFGVIDPWATLCSNGICSTRRNMIDFYRDGHHLSVAGSSNLMPEFKKSILEFSK